VGLVMGHFCRGSHHFRLFPDSPPTPAPTRRGSSGAEVAADPWRAAPMLLELGQRGIAVLDWPQSNERACPASQRLRDLIVDGKLRHPGDHDLDRAVEVAIATQVPRGWRIDRPGGRGARDEPIDPLVALLMAVDRALAPKREVKLLGWL
jgi:phage terminase large subunit-like protein